MSESSSTLLEQRPPVTPSSRGAAFFDVDRTLLAGASGLYLARPLRQHGLLTARQVVRTMLGQAVFAARGQNHAQIDRANDVVSAVMAGWKRDTFLHVVETELERRIRPMVFDEAIERIAQHHQQGMPVYAVSATMEEVIAPLAAMLGLDGAIATQLEVVDGLFTGRVSAPCHGPDKAARLRAFAAAEGIDLAASVAYSDSITDAEFLQATGRAYAVNPDKQLRALAEAEGWGILRFTTRVRAPLHRSTAARAGVLALVAGLAVNAVRRRVRARR
ncbi:MAG: HAD-superfamily subfamily hydrolase [Thermoleophilia bacterium]|nr:HAD-superfamily subfamily hydrolase [Thermoleophilia bacterium]